MHLRRIDPWVASGTLIAIAVAAIMVTLPRDGFLAHTAADDAYYYFAIAQRAGAAQWPTFDGVHVTTGFHPLWLFAMVGLAKIFTAPWALPRAAIAASSAVAILASLSFAHLFRRAWGTNAGVVGALLLVASPGFSRLGWMGMETPLALLTVSMFLRALFDEARNRSALRLGGWAALAILARLDMAIVVAVALGWTALATSIVPKRTAAIAALAAAIFVAPYVAWNVALTGHATTISSATKAYVAGDAALRNHGGRLTAGFAGDVERDLARVGRDVARMSPLSIAAGPIALAGLDHPSAVVVSKHRGAVALFFAVACGVGAIFCARRRWWRRDASARVDVGPLAVLAIASGVHTTLACVLLSGQSGPWYWGLELVTIVAAIAFAAARWRGARVAAGLLCGATIASMAMLGVALVGARSAGRFDRRASFGAAILDAGAQLEARRAPGEVVGSCNAGTLGFFQPGVVNLDGLVNDWRLLEARKRGETQRWLAREDVRWIVDCVPAGAKESYARQLGLTLEDVESVAEVDGPACVAFVWRLAPQRAIAANP